MANSNCRSFGGRVLIKSVNYFWAFLKDAEKSQLFIINELFKKNQ